jgi:hypothetical protein
MLIVCLNRCLWLAIKIFVCLFICKSTLYIFARAVGRQSAMHTENSGFASPTLGQHISTFRGYVFDTNNFRQVKTGNFISKAHVYLNSWYITWLQNSCNVTWFHMWREKYETCLHHLYCSKLNTYMNKLILFYSILFYARWTLNTNQPINQSINYI